MDAEKIFKNISGNFFPNFFQDDRDIIFFGQPNLDLF